MKTSNPLIDVDFIDRSNYVQPLDTDDIVGVVAETVWGKTDEFQVLDQTGWTAVANPNNLGRINQSYATITRLFNSGAKYIELYRLGSSSDSSNGEVIQCFAFDGTNFESYQVPVKDDLEWATQTIDDKFKENPARFRYRYAGGFNGKLVIKKYSGQRPKELDDSVPMFTLEFFIESTSNSGEDKYVKSATESFNFTLKRVSISGESLFFADVLNSKSQYFKSDLDLEPTVEQAPVSPVECEISVSEPTFSESDYADAYSKFIDRDLSRATILISTYDPNTANADTTESKIIKSIYGVVSKRMDLVGLIGCPKKCFESIEEGERVTAIENYFNTIQQTNSFDKFLGAIAAVERVTVNNKVFYLDGTASWAGAICNVAANLQNRNQLPSYKAYGSTNAVLVKTLGFDSVVKLMDETGIGSIYKSSIGNYIFNVRSRYSLQQSYFGKLNVMRVTAAVLHWLLTDCEYVIHTAVVSDEGDRIAFQERCNKKLSQMIARGELKSESFISCSNEINTDALTNGGECLNIECYLWYKKLAERVKITIIATDTTTSVDIAQG